MILADIYLARHHSTQLQPHDDNYLQLLDEKVFQRIISLIISISTTSSIAIMASVPYSRPRSCSHCRKLVLDFSEKRYIPLRLESGHPPYVFDSTIVNIERAAATGCSLCSELLKKGNQSGHTWSKYAKLAVKCRRIGWMDFRDFYVGLLNRFDHSNMLGRFLMASHEGKWDFSNAYINVFHSDS